MIKFPRLTALAFATSSALLVAAACSGSDGSSPSSQQAEGDSASIQLGLDVRPGVTVNSADYVLTGPGGFTRAGSIDLSNSTKL